MAISDDEVRVTTATVFAQRLRWGWPENGPRRPQPTVVLLGPAGSGKSYALKSIETDCGQAIVHAGFDFGREEPATTVEVLLRLAYALQEKWPARRAARFARLALGVIAVAVPVKGIDREQDRETMRRRLAEFADNPRADLTADAVAVLAGGVKESGIVHDPKVNALVGFLKVALPPLIRRVGRKPLAKAKQWLVDIPEAGSAANLLDALLNLHEKAHSEPAMVTRWLTQAFLADVRENHRAMSKPDPASPCECDNPGDVRHVHNWMLLLDNIDRGSGAAFIKDLHDAQRRHLNKHVTDHDPLVLVATSGRWISDWETDWRPPWRTVPDEPDHLRTVVRCSDAGYRHWAEESRAGNRPPAHYPVLLEPLTRDETARILGVSESSEKCVLAQRASFGLPAAVETIAARLREHKHEPAPGARDVLRPSDDAKPESELWRDRLEALRLAQHLPGVGIEGFVTAAPFATAPWLVPADSDNRIQHPDVGQILTELRTALWVLAPERGRGTADPAVLHPWIAGNLAYALVSRDAESGLPSYTDQFEALLDDPGTQAEDVRMAYCRLALGRIGEVVEFFEKSFDRVEHQVWIDRLDLVTRAPDDKPLSENRAALFNDLVTAGADSTPAGGSRVRNTIARLVVAQWLSANPFAMPDQDQQKAIEAEYRNLHPRSYRPDVGALITAAEHAAIAQL